VTTSLGAPGLLGGLPEATSTITTPSSAQPQCPGQFGSEILRGRTKAPAPHLPVLDQLGHHGAGHPAGHGEPDPHVAAGGGEDRAVDPDQLAAQIDQGAPRVARVDGGIGLNEVLVAFDIEPGPAQRADDAGGDGLPNRDYRSPDVVAYLSASGSERQRPRLSALICSSAMFAGVAADDPGLKLAAVFSVTSTSRALDHGMVGQHIAAAASRSRRKRPGAAAAGREPKAPEERILEQRIVLLGRAGQHRDVHHAVGDLLEQRRKAGHRAVWIERRDVGPRQPGPQGQQRGGAAQTTGQQHGSASHPVGSIVRLIAQARAKKADHLRQACRRDAQSAENGRTLTTLSIAHGQNFNPGFSNAGTTRLISLPWAVRGSVDTRTN
jgi:hypothetical protein